MTTTRVPGSWSVPWPGGVLVLGVGLGARSSDQTTSNTPPLLAHVMKFCDPQFFTCKMTVMMLNMSEK